MIPTTLTTIAYLFSFGSIIGISSVLLFGVAVLCRSTNIAPRCTARPADTIYSFGPFTEKNKCQNRGNPFTGWVLWTLKLSYGTMLKGIPGTGTRANGMKGKMLDVNLDGIVLLRFHVLCFKVAILTTILALGVILPLNFTAHCFSSKDGLSQSCNDPTNDKTNFSNYMRTTLANIPASVSHSWSSYDEVPVLFRPFFAYEWGGASSNRLYGIVLCAWLIYYYTCTLLQNEWKEVLALRRVYYLENDLWARRKLELEATIYASSDDNDDESETNDDDAHDSHNNASAGHDDDAATAMSNSRNSKLESLRRKRAKRRSAWIKKQEKKHNLRQRNPWIPPPEQRETVPNIELYSVLVGGLPCLPSEVLLSKQKEVAGFNKAHSAIDWQLELVSSFFNHCVPTQPGFSSSVAAVTILPDAPSLARAWRRWYTAAAALRRLRFIRTLISEIRHCNVELSDSSNSDDDDDGFNSQTGKLSLQNQGYVEAPLNSAAPLTFPSGTTPAVLVPAPAKCNSFDPLHMQGNVVACFPLDSAGVIVAPGTTPALSTTITKPPNLTTFDRNLTTYTEQWWKNNQATPLGQQFMQTFAQQNTNEHQHLASSTKHTFVQANQSQNVVTSTTTGFSNTVIPSNAIPSSTYLNHFVPDPNDLQLYDEDDENNSVDPAERAQFALSYYRNVFGADDNFDVEAQFFQALQFGPEQSSVYSRELAQSAANCCPYGCGESRLRRCGIDELLTLEREAVIKVHNANIALQCAQARAAVSVLIARSGKKNKKEIECNEGSSNRGSANKNSNDLDERVVDDDFNDSDEPGATPTKHGKSKSMPKQSPLTLSPRFRYRKSLPSPVPKSLEMEWELLVKENARKEILSSNSSSSNFTLLHSNPNTFTMENTDGSSLPPPPPSSRRSHPKLNGGGLVKAASVRFSKRHDTDEMTAGHHGGLVKSASARLMNEPPGIKMENANTVYPSNLPCNQMGTDINTFRRSPSAEQQEDHHDNTQLKVAACFNNGVPEPANQHPQVQKNRKRDLTSESLPNRERCLTAESMLSSGSFTPSIGNHRQQSSRWTGLSLTSEGTVSSRRTLSSTNFMNSNGEANNSYTTGTGISPSTGLFYSSIDDFDPYAIMKHKKSDGDDLEYRPRLNSWDDYNINDSKRSNFSNRRKLSRNQQSSTFDDLIGLQPVDQWEKVQQICNSHNGAGSNPNDIDPQGTGEQTPTSFDNGVWDPITLVEFTKDNIRSLPRRLWSSIASFCKKKSDKISDRHQSNSTYAVVTFTNRQAALAARHLVTDGRGANRWIAVEKLPVPPLADSASCDLITCRGCCRPLSLSISNNEKMVRKWLAMLTLAIINIFYCFPISYAASLVSDIQFFEGWERIPLLTNNNLSGVVQASIFSLFFALCPLMFRSIANGGSNATSVFTAENAAINYFWWFMVITAFSGTSFMMMGKAYFITTGPLNTNVTQVLLEIAATIPTTVSAAWINWIILHSTCILPNQYLLQFNSFVFKYIGWNCCARAVMGGGPGGNIPYRVYVDSCVVLMCTIALSPASPIVAPCATLYFLIMFPLLRRNCIYVYRPKFDGGGLRWTFLFQACITSMLVGQILLSLIMGLKKAIGPALLAALPIPLTLVFRNTCLKRFFRAYKDAGLLQTSLLDQWDTSWDNSSHPSMEKREEFRRFLVDAHKAAYIPVCIAGDATSSLTVEPAIVVPSESDGVSCSVRSQEPGGSIGINPHVFHDTSCTSVSG